MKKIYSVKIEPLTAVHIGSGETLTPLDYKVVELKLKTGALNKLFAKYSSDEIIARLINSDNQMALKRFENASASANMKEMQKFFHDEFTLDDLQYPCDVTKEFLNVYNKNISGDPLDNALEVLQMYRPAGKKTPVIPGSSVKGSVRTALLNRVMHEISDDEYYRLLGNHMEKIDNIHNNKKRYDKENSPIQKELLKFNDAKNDPMRTIAFADFEFGVKNTQAVGVLKNISVDKSQNELKTVGIQIMAEFLKGNLIANDIMANGNIIIDEDLQKSVIDLGNPKKDFRMNTKFSINDIVSSCNYFFKREFDKEYESFYKPCSEGTDLVVKLKKHIDEICSSNNSFIIRVGRWSQAEFVTFEDNFRRPKTPEGKPYGTTRTVLDYNGNFVPMGWCKCTVENI